MVINAGRGVKITIVIEVDRQQAETVNVPATIEEDPYFNAMYGIDEESIPTVDDKV